MGSQVPPVLGRNPTGPPLAPPDVPALSQYGAGTPPTAATAGAVPRAAFEVSRALDLLARMVPGSGAILDRAKALVSQVVMMASRGGTSGAEEGNEESPSGEPTPPPAESAKP